MTAFVVLIGVHGREDNVDGLLTVVQVLLNMTATRNILLMQLLPQAEDQSKWKPDTLLARKTYQAAADAVNEELVRYEPFQEGNRVTLLNCNKLGPRVVVDRREVLSRCTEQERT